MFHISPNDSKGHTKANVINDFIKNSDLEENVVIVGTDGTASMTGAKNGCLRALEEPRWTA